MPSLSTQIQFAFNKLVLRASALKDEKDQQGLLTDRLKPEIDNLLKLIKDPKPFSEDMAKKMLVAINTKTLEAFIKNDFNTTYDTTVVKDKHPRAHQEIDTLHTYVQSINWFQRLFFPSALMTQLEKFDPFTQEGAKDQDVYQALSQTNRFFKFLIHLILPGLKEFANSERTQAAVSKLASKPTEKIVTPDEAAAKKAAADKAAADKAAADKAAAKPSQQGVFAPGSGAPVPQDKPKVQPSGLCC